MPRSDALTPTLYDEREFIPEPALPCPFCGYLPVAQPWHGGAPTKHKVGCSSDDCPVSPTVTGETLDDALAEWNRRTPTDRIVVDQATMDALHRAVQTRHPLYFAGEVALLRAHIARCVVPEVDRG